MFSLLGLADLMLHVKVCFNTWLLNLKQVWSHVVKTTNCCLSPAKQKLDLLGGGGVTAKSGGSAK